MYLEPFSFEEFLDATGHEQLRIFLSNFNFDLTIPDALHSKLLQLLKEYLIIGGMPAAVKSWISDKNLATVKQIQYDLLSTYRDDFSKYSGRINLQRLEDILSSVPRQLGQKFIYHQANPDSTSSSLKQALELLLKARICHHVAFT